MLTPFRALLYKTLVGVSSALHLPPCPCRVLGSAPLAATKAKKAAAGGAPTTKAGKAPKPAAAPKGAATGTKQKVTRTALPKHAAAGRSQGGGAATAQGATPAIAVMGGSGVHSGGVTAAAEAGAGAGAATACCAAPRKAAAPKKQRAAEAGVGQWGLEGSHVGAAGAPVTAGGAANEGDAGVAHGGAGGGAAPRKRTKAADFDPVAVQAKVSFVRTPCGIIAVFLREDQRRRKFEQICAAKRLPFHLSCW